MRPKILGGRPAKEVQLAVRCWGGPRGSPPPRSGGFERTRAESGRAGPVASTPLRYAENGAVRPDRMDAPAGIEPAHAGLGNRLQRGIGSPHQLDFDSRRRSSSRVQTISGARLAFRAAVGGCRRFRGRLPRLGRAVRWPRATRASDGISIENRRWVERADYLRCIPAALRFISAEPLHGPLIDLDLQGIDSLIAGGESGL